MHFLHRTLLRSLNLLSLMHWVNTTAPQTLHVWCVGIDLHSGKILSGIIIWSLYTAYNIRMGYDDTFSCTYMATEIISTLLFLFYSSATAQHIIIYPNVEYFVPIEDFGVLIWCYMCLLCHVRELFNRAWKYFFGYVLDAQKNTQR